MLISGNMGLPEINMPEPLQCQRLEGKKAEFPKNRR